jgi:hypothetical protein
MYLRNASHLVLVFFARFFLCNVTVFICTNATALEGHDQRRVCLLRLFRPMLASIKISFHLSLFKEMQSAVVSFSTWVFCAFYDVSESRSRRTDRRLSPLVIDISRRNVPVVL